MTLGLSHFTDRVGEGIGQPRLDSAAGEELMHVLPGVTIALGRRSPESPGTLYISTRRVIWLSDTERDKGYAVEFLSISLHAVSRDPETYPSPCIYTQIEIETTENEEYEGSDVECPEETDILKIAEMRLVPYDPNQLDTLFEIFCQCVELNPEPLEGEEENSWVFGDEGFTDDGMHNEISLSGSFQKILLTQLDMQMKIMTLHIPFFISKLMINALRMRKKWKMLITIRFDSALLFHLQEKVSLDSVNG